MTSRDSHFVREHRWVTRALAEGRAGAADPDLDLLVESLAFLAGRVHARVDGAARELFERVAEMTRPQLLRLLPAATVVQARVAGVRPHRLPAGTELVADTSLGEPCRFRTCDDLTVAACRIAAVDARIDGETPELVVRIVAEAPGALAGLGDDGLRLFIAAEAPLAYDLAHWALHHCREVHVRVDGRTVQVLPPPTLAPAGRAENADLPTGTRLLQGFWSLPARLLFLDLRPTRVGLADASACELVLRCPGAPELAVRTCPDDLKLGCVAAVNLFLADAVPIRTDLLTERYELRVDGLSPRFAEIWALRSVTAVPLGRGEGQALLTAAELVAAHATARSYGLARSRSPLDGASDLELVLGNPRPAREIVRVSLLATNRELAADLEPGPWRHRDGGRPDLGVRPVTRVSPPLRPRLDEAVLGRLATHLALDLADLLSAERMRRYLALYALHPDETPGGRRCANHLAALRSLVAEPSLCVTPRGPVRGVAVLALLDERGFSGPGEAFFFGHVLRAILIDHAPLNTALDFTARLTPSGSELRWPPHPNCPT